MALEKIEISLAATPAEYEQVLVAMRDIKPIDGTSVFNFDGANIIAHIAGDNAASLIGAINAILLPITGGPVNITIIPNSSTKVTTAAEEAWKRIIMNKCLNWFFLH